jgi:hypothetical protein
MTSVETVSEPRRFDITSSRSYIHDLFTFVLDRSTVNEQELNHWVEYLVKSQNPADVLRRFGRSEENTSRLEAKAEARSGYPAGHFYSPVVDVDQFRRHETRIYGPRALIGIDLNVPVQKMVFDRLKRHIELMPFSEASDGHHRYYYSNTSYGFGDAAIYWAMLSDLRPRRIIEVGSGFTSALALDAIDVLGLQTTCTFIDPHPQLLLEVSQPFASCHRILTQEVQTIDPGVVDDLGPNDILFIDSSHVVKTGSDVHFELTELLPRLHSGVIVHFHDMFYPFEYPKRWVDDLRKSWNELYFIQSFLMWNREFSVQFFNDFFVRNHASDLASLPGATRNRLQLNPGGGLWLRRT